MTFDEIVKMRPPSHPVPQNVFNGTKMPSKCRMLRLNHQKLDREWSIVGTVAGKQRWKKRMDKVVVLEDM